MSTSVCNICNIKCTDRLSKPLLSRFTLFEIPEYTYEQFEKISVKLIKKLPQNAGIQIASSIWKTGSKDILNSDPVIFTTYYFESMPQ